MWISINEYMMFIGKFIRKLRDYAERYRGKASLAGLAYFYVHFLNGELNVNNLKVVIQ